MSHRMRPSSQQWSGKDRRNEVSDGEDEEEDGNDSYDDDDAEDSEEGGGSDGEEYSDSDGQYGGSGRAHARAPAPAVNVADLPLGERLRLMAAKNDEDAYASVNNSNRRVKKPRKRPADADADTGGSRHGLTGDAGTAPAPLKMTHKSAPACMPSNRPVKRLRVDANNTTATFRDPRFSNVSGKLNNDKFMQAYSFLDKQQEQEVEGLQKALKKTKSEGRKEALKESLVKNKQELMERRRDQKVKEKLRELKAEEREKVKQGKTPYFLKRTTKEAIAVEERYNELKKGGKLGKFMEKKRQRNASKDQKKMPMRRDY